MLPVPWGAFFLLVVTGLYSFKESGILNNGYTGFKRKDLKRMSYSLFEMTVLFCLKR